MSKLDDLLFLIGLFLTMIGAVVFGTFAFGPDDVVQTIHVNLLGSCLLLGVGIVMIVLSYTNKRNL